MVSKRLLPLGKEKKGNGSASASLELLYNISRELAAALDLHTVLQRVLFLSMKNVGAINGSIIVLDDNGQPVESAIIVGEQLHDHTTQQLRATFDHGLAGWVGRERQAVLIENTTQDKRWLRRPGEVEGPGGAKSAVSTPILARDKLIGVVTLVHPKPGFFKPAHLDLVRAIADQAGIAVLNARLYEESQRQARVMTALANSAAVITSSLEQSKVLQSILEQISQALRVEVVSLALVEPRQEELLFCASTSDEKHNVVGVRLKLGQGIAGWVAKEGVGTIVQDVSSDPRWFAGVDHQTGFKTHAIACAPIHWRGSVIGIMQAINPKEGSFDPDALLVLTGIGGLAGTAISHAQLFERLDAAHQRYHELFENSIDPILITDWEGHILEANHQVEDITHSDNASLRALYCEDLNIVDWDVVGPGFTKLTSGLTCSYEVNLHTPSGTLIPVQVNVCKIKIDNIDHLQWILHDLTERRNLENLRNDLISMIYHDLRSPLTNVVSSLDVLETMLPLENDAALKSLLNIAVRSTERIQRLTNSLLDMRRLDAGHKIADLQLSSPAELIKDAVDAIQTTADTKKQRIDVELPPELPHTLVDADMIRRVLINLLENAVKYTPTESCIRIGAQVMQDNIQIWIEDNGPGIQAADREYIFDRFTRLHRPDSPRGFGLGLAYCRLAVEAHGGHIWVEDAPNAGARFVFNIPLPAANGNGD